MKTWKPVVILAIPALAIWIVRSKRDSAEDTNRPRKPPIAIMVEVGYKPIMTWAAHRSLVGRNRSGREPGQGRFTRSQVDRILEQTWRNFNELAPNVPRAPTVGSSMNMMLACITYSCWQALMAEGIERDYAIELIADVVWKVYEKWGIVPAIITRMLTADPAERMHMSANLFLRFPFNPPGYRFERLSSTDGIAFDIRRCPVAEYFQAQNATDLCVGAWCNQDYALAELWGGWLERRETLAAGYDRCDFRFRTRSQASNRQAVH